MACRGHRYLASVKPGRERLARSGKIKRFDAIASLNEALTLDPSCGQYHRLLAQWLAQNPGCWEPAQEHFERAIELNDKDVEAYLGLAALHEEASHKDKASPLYEHILSLDPGNRVARENCSTPSPLTE